MLNRSILPRLPERFAHWLCAGENPFKLNHDQLLWFAAFVKKAERTK
jgi:hypothetical protein